jgi:hypothetical protein
MSLRAPRALTHLAARNVQAGSLPVPTADLSAGDACPLPEDVLTRTAALWLQAAASRQSENANTALVAYPVDISSLEYPALSDATLNGGPFPEVLLLGSSWTALPCEVMCSDAMAGLGAIQ